MKNSQFNFGKNFRADANVNDLIDLGWYFDEDADGEKYHVELHVDEEGKTFWNFVNSEKKRQKIWEGSDEKETGDDEQTIKDIFELFSADKLWNCEQV